MQLLPPLPRCFSNWSPYLDHPLTLTFSFNLYIFLGFNLFRVYNLNSWGVFAQSRMETAISLRDQSWGPLYCRLEYLQVFEINTQSEHDNEGHPQVQGPVLSLHHSVIWFRGWESPEGGDQGPPRDA